MFTTRCLGNPEKIPAKIFGFGKLFSGKKFKLILFGSSPFPSIYNEQIPELKSYDTRSGKKFVDKSVVIAADVESSKLAELV